MLRIRKIINNLIGERKRGNRNLFILTLKYLSLAFIILFAFSIIVLVSHFSIIKQAIAYTAQGKTALESALYHIQARDFKNADEFSKTASDNFYSAANKLGDLQNSPLVKYSYIYNNEIENIICLLESLKYISDAAAEGSFMGAEITGLLGKNDLNFSEFSVADKRKILDYFYKSTNKIIALKKIIQSASQEAGGIRTNTILWPIRAQVMDLKNSLSRADEILSKTIPMTKLIPPLFGYPEKADYLVLLQNSDELRPTGGFLGTFGLLEVYSGDIINFDTHDTYHLDMPVKDLVNVKPPWPLEKYLAVPKWYMRDANWSPDWPVASAQINWFYLKENKYLPKPFSAKDFDFVMGITPKFITQLLKLTGPVTIEGVEYNEDNFTDLLEYRVEKGYVKAGESSWQRKEVIGEISKQIKIELFNQPLNKWPVFLDILSKSAESKDIVLSANSQVLQKIIINSGLGGELKETSGDYLMVVDANMAALKTDAVIKRSIDYSIEQKNDGFYANLRIRYEHNGDADWKTSKYRTYTRVFVPKGSRLIKGAGQTEGEIYENTELNKTYFGLFLEVPIRKSASINLHYKLPPNIIINNKYSLYIQKQPGSDIRDLSVNLKFDNKIDNFYPNSYSALNNSKLLNWQTDLLSDKNFVVNLKNN
jgi:hypothetical protein